jgi:hypothetical protein
MADIIKFPTTTHATTLYGNWATYTYGSESLVYDGDLNTYIGVRNDAYGGGRERGDCSLTSDHTWVMPIPILSVFAKMYTARTAYTGNYANRCPAGQIEVQQTIYLRISNVWTQIWDYRIVAPSNADTRPDWYINNSPTVTGLWQNVTGVRVYQYAYGYAYEGQRANTEWNYLYELQANAPLGGLAYIL